MKICLWLFDRAKIILTKLYMPFELIWSGQLICTLGYGKSDFKDFYKACDFLIEFFFFFFFF